MTTPATPIGPDAPLAARLWAYQAERFPLRQTVPLLAVFSAASVTVSAALAGRALPGPGVYLVAFFVVLVIFFQMRAMDEVKDAETDRRYRPERPIPRGLVSLRLVVGLAAAALLPAGLAAWWLAPGLVLLALLVWLWLGLMTAEFFAPRVLRRSPGLYLVSHMAIMPLIDLFLTGCEWLPRAGYPPDGIWTFLWMSFCNGSVMEFGRKIWAPEQERPGVETYSSSWGRGRALAALALALAGALAGLLACGVYLGAAVPVAVCGGAAALAMALVLWRFHARPSARTQARLETASGLWVLLCYGTPALVPVAGSWVS